MKKTVLILALLLLFGCGLAVFCAESRVKTIDLASVAEGGSAGGSSALADDPSLLLSFSYDSVALPENEDGTVLIPVIPETGITVTCARGAELTRRDSSFTGESGTYRSVAVTVKKGGRARTVTLTETGIPLARLALNVPDITSDRDPVEDKKRAGTLQLLSIDEQGGLRLETGAVSVKLRGGSSRGYTKKSYTLTNLDASGREVSRSLMGLPADTKYGLNSMYEDDVKLRDMLSLGIWADMQPAGTPYVRMRYCELYIDHTYWGLYGFQQVVSANTLELGPGDGLLKIISDLTTEAISARQTRKADVIRPLADGDAARLFLDALAGLCERSPEALARFDRESLYRYALFIQLVAGTDNVSKNIVAAYRAGRGVFSLTAYDTDQSFGLTWDNDCAPLFMGVHPELSGRNLLKGSYSPWSGLVSTEMGVAGELNALWTTLRKGPLQESVLLEKARALFALVTESGARERERTRWPGGNYAGSPNQVERFIRERLPWCDTYFAGLY